MTPANSVPPWHSRSSRFCRISSLTDRNARSGTPCGERLSAPRVSGCACTESPVPDLRHPAMKAPELGPRKSQPSLPSGSRAAADCAELHGIFFSVVRDDSPLEGRRRAEVQDQTDFQACRPQVIQKLSFDVWVHTRTRLEF